LAELTVVASESVSMSHLLCGDGQTLSGARGAENFARYPKGSPLSSLPEVVPHSAASGLAVLYGAPDAANEALFENGLQQYVADARRGGLFLDVFIRIAGN